MKLKDLQLENEDRNKKLKVALETVYPIREQLKKDLLETQNEDLLDKIIILNKIIKDAEAVLGMNSNEAIEFYAKNHPEYVNEDKSVNDRSIRRVAILKKKWEKLGFMKNKP